MNIQVRGKVPVNQPPVSRSGFTLASLNLPMNILRPRIKGDIIPPITVGREFRAGDSVLWIISDDKVGFMYGTVLNAANDIRALFQDGIVRTFETDKLIHDPRLLDNTTAIGGLQMLINITDPGLNYFYGDPVLVGLWSMPPQQATIQAADNANNIATVHADDGTRFSTPYRNMVLRGEGFSIPQRDSNYNAVKVVS